MLSANVFVIWTTSRPAVISLTRFPWSSKNVIVCRSCAITWIATGKSQGPASIEETSQMGNAL